MPSLWHYLSRAPMKARKLFFARAAERLHIGSGPEILSGWVNIDVVRYPGVDVKLDVLRGLPFRDVRFIFAEHFIEHFTMHEAMYLLRECRRVLRPDGVLRLTTPNLDWVWASHYRLRSEAPAAVRKCFELNRAFSAWGHRFLYNFETLSAVLQDAGFANVTRCEFRESAHAELRGLERHERSEDVEELADILVVEASGEGGRAPSYLAQPQQDFFHHLGAQ